MDISISRGTKDILPEDITYWTHIESTARSIFKLYDYNEIRTPIFESVDLFNRVIGESDIVKKEMYTFTDKGNRNLALRPEGTAPIARAFITNRLDRKAAESKLFYIGPMFRYERPQAGRYRQFHQIGVESIGSDHPYTDAEVIAMAYRLFTKLGLKNVKILINSVGSETCRPVIEARIKQFLSASLNQFSDDLKKKFYDNPLRMLDSKDKTVQTYLAGLPDLRDVLSQKSKDHFNYVLSYLDHLNIPFEYTPTLVRGLDYYTETVFEVVSEDLGAQNSICGGGRYNNLIAEIGGKKTPAVGFAFGLERIILVMEKQAIKVSNEQRIIYIAALDTLFQIDCVSFAETLRNIGLTVVLDYNKSSFSSHLKKAQKLNANYLLVYGEDESDNKKITIKSMDEKKQDTILITELETYFKGKLNL